MKRLFVVLVMMVGVCSQAWAGNTHGVAGTEEWKFYSGDWATGYVVSGCLPAASGTTTTGTFACNAYVKGSSGELVYVTQATKSVGPLSGGNGTYWVAIHRDVSTAVSGWTRQAGTHYLWQKNASLPTEPAQGLIVAQVVLAASQVTKPTLATATRPLRLSSYALDVTDYGATGDGATDNTEAFERAHAALASAGGALLVPPGTYWFAGQVDFTKPVRLVTAGRERTIFHATTTGYPLIYTTASLDVRGVTFTRTDAAVATSHAAIRLADAPTAGTRLLVQDVTITGFDVGIYTESASGRANLENVTVTDCVVTSNTANTGSVNPTLNLNNALHVEVARCTLTQSLTTQMNNTYFFSPKHFFFHDNTVVQGIGIKLDTNPTDGIDTARIVNNTFTSASLAIETLTDTSAIRVLQIDNNLFESGRVLDATTGEIYISNNATTPPSPTDYDLISIKNNVFRNTDKRAIMFDMGAGHTLGTVHLYGNLYYNWSAGSAGTYYAVQKGGSGTYRDLLIENELANGNSNGKAYWNLGFSNESIGTIFETGTTVSTSTPLNAIKYLDRLRLRNGVEQSAGMKHQRVTTGSLTGGGARTDVVLTWSAAFPDANYTVVAFLVDTTGAGAGLRLERIRVQSASAVTFQVINDAAGAITGAIHAIAFHD